MTIENKETMREKVTMKDRFKKFVIGSYIKAVVDKDGKLDPVKVYSELMYRIVTLYAKVGFGVGLLHIAENADYYMEMGYASSDLIGGAVIKAVLWVPLVIYNLIGF